MSAVLPRALELHSDWKYSNCSYVCSLFRPEIYQALDLGRHGLEVVPLQGSVTFKQNGDYLGSYHQPSVRRREIARHSKKRCQMLPLGLTLI